VLVEGLVSSDVGVVWMVEWLRAGGWATYHAKHVAYHLSHVPIQQEVSISMSVGELQV
jgi:hypothetical protein